MSDDPVSNPDPKETGRNPSDGRWWIASLLSPVICAAVGFLIALCVRSMKGDPVWVTGMMLLWFFGATFLGAVLCVIFAAVSFARHEKRRIWAVLAAVPCLLWVVRGTVAIIQEMTM